MLGLWREQKTVIYGLFLIFFWLIMTLAVAKTPPGELNKRIPGNMDKIVMATEAPDYIQIYKPEKGRPPRLYPSDERLNDMKVDKAGERIFVVTKEGWLNIFSPEKWKRQRKRFKLGDILQGVALSGDEKYVAVGLGSKVDYNARDVNIYDIEKIMASDPDDVPMKSSVHIMGDIQAIFGNPDPGNNRGYIISSQDDTLTIFDFATGSQISTVEVGNSMGFFKCRPDGKKGYGSINATMSIAVVDLMKNQEKTIKHIRLPTSPYYLAFNADGSHLYAGSRDESEVYVIDTATDEIVWTYNLVNPYAYLRLTSEIIAVSTDEKYLYMVPQYGIIMIYELNKENAEENTSEVHAIQKREFVKAPTIMEVIRPK